MNTDLSVNGFDATPRASVLIESMRDLGYSLETALADIVDNSITAGAQNIQILSYPGEIEVKLAILDDGCGMSWDELKLAMRPGSKSPRESRQSRDLSRFGLGLKTASFSQCRKLTVVTRKSGVTHAACWDLDVVAKRDEWIVHIPQNPQEIPFVDKLGEQGTLVLWEKLDRLISGGGASDDSQRHLSSRLHDAQKHLELVFHRYLTHETNNQKVEIRFNNRPLQPFDPFHKAKSIQDPPESIRIGESVVRVKAYTLPHHQKVSKDEWNKYAGEGGYVKNQGFYVYRERRLIIHGTWFKLARKSELSKLSRVQIDIPNSLDTEWKIDVKKASAQPPKLVRDRLGELVERICRTSKRVYTRRGGKLTQKENYPIWNRAVEKGKIQYCIDSSHPVIQEFSSGLHDYQKSTLLGIMRMISAGLPYDAFFADLSDSPDEVICSDMQEDDLRAGLRAIIKANVRFANDPMALYEALILAEPYRSHKDLTASLIKEIIDNENTE